VTPLALDDALDLVPGCGGALMINQRSGRAVVKLAARSVIDEEGHVHRRHALRRPIEKTHITAAELDTSHWKNANVPAFCAAWKAELGELPEYETSTLHIVTGLLLPIWKRLPRIDPGLPPPDR